MGRAANLARRHENYVRNHTRVFYEDKNLGSFFYNPYDWKIDENGLATEDGMRACLVYIGKEKDGNKIYIPNGIKDCSAMFKDNKSILSAPKLPESVECCDNMFDGCDNLVDASNIDFHDKVKSASHMFSGCSNMVVGPKSVVGVEKADSMFSWCEKLQNAPLISDSLTKDNGMFERCSIHTYCQGQSKLQHKISGKEKFISKVRDAMLGKINEQHFEAAKRQLPFIDYDDKPVNEYGYY